jgi:D-tyrosyl-tRNA(Tyr) deacylase
VLAGFELTPTARLVEKQRQRDQEFCRPYRVTAAFQAGVSGRSHSPNAIARSATTGAIGLATKQWSNDAESTLHRAIAFALRGAVRAGGTFCPWQASTRQRYSSRCSPSGSS